MNTTCAALTVLIALSNAGGGYRSQEPSWRKQTSQEPLGPPAPPQGADGCGGLPGAAACRPCPWLISSIPSGWSGPDLSTNRLVEVSGPARGQEQAIQEELAAKVHYYSSQSFVYLDPGETYLFRLKKGQEDVDFCQIKVFSKANPERSMPHIFMTHPPTQDLWPDEEVRTPLVALQFWQAGDWIRAQNVWRRWMVAHNLPRPGGQLVPTHYGGCFGSLEPRAADEVEQIDGWLREGIHLDYWFIDAGWYTHPGEWWNTGTWEIDRARFPRGLREVADHAHTKGAKFVVWFQPERLVDGSWLAQNHPEWILRSGGARLLNLGNAEAWKWVVERVDGLLTSEGIDVYRQDFNMDPLGCWRAADTPDRQGITEIRQSEKYLLGDFYPLAAWSLARDVWVAWQYDRPEQGEGLVQAFRREESPYETARFKLRGLEKGARYVVTDLDHPEVPRQFSGLDLMDRGLPIILSEPRSSGLLIYRRSTE